MHCIYMYIAIYLMDSFIQSSKNWGHFYDLIETPVVDVSWGNKDTLFLIIKIFKSLDIINPTLLQSSSNVSC